MDGDGALAHAALPPGAEGGADPATGGVSAARVQPLEYRGNFYQGWNCEAIALKRTMPITLIGPQ